MEPSDVDRQVLGVEYCTGYVDGDGQWRKGFYCPKKADGATATLEKSKDIFCCGTQTSKFCCERKEGFTTTTTSGFYVSFSTLVSVTTVTFILAVLLTALAFICCKRYWKERDRNLEIHETHFYRMACSSSNAPLVSPPFSASFHSNAAAASYASPLTSPPSTALLDVFQPYSLTLPHHRRSSTTQHDSLPGANGTLSVIEPPGYPCPPPLYQSHPSLVLETSPDLSSNNSNCNNTNSPANNNIVSNNSVSIVVAQPKPNNGSKPPKPFWRKLSQ